MGKIPFYTYDQLTSSPQQSKKGGISFVPDDVYNESIKKPQEEPEDLLTMWDKSWINKPLVKTGWEKTAERYDPVGGRRESDAKIPEWVPGIGGGTWRSLGAGLLEGRDRVIEEMSTPMNLASIATGFGAEALAARGLGTAAHTTNLVNRALGAPQTISGVARTRQGWREGDLAKTVMGITEATGGLADTFGPAPNVKPRTKPTVEPPPAAATTPPPPMKELKVEVVKPTAPVDTSLPAIVTVKAPTQAVISQLRDKGYVAIGINAEGRAQWARSDVAPMYRQNKPVTPPAKAAKTPPKPAVDLSTLPEVEMPETTQIADPMAARGAFGKNEVPVTDTKAVDGSRVSARYIKNMAKSGYEIVGKAGKYVIFKMKQEKGAVNFEDMVKLLQEKLGRMPNADEVQTAMEAEDKILPFQPAEEARLSPGEETGAVAPFPAHAGAMDEAGNPKFEHYRLPDGTVIPVDATASKGAPTISHQMKGGKIVEATKVDAPATPSQLPKVDGFDELMGAVKNGDLPRANDLYNQYVQRVQGMDLPTAQREMEILTNKKNADNPQDPSWAALERVVLAQIDKFAPPSAPRPPRMPRGAAVWPPGSGNVVRPVQQPSGTQLGLPGTGPRPDVAIPPDAPPTPINGLIADVRQGRMVPTELVEPNMFPPPDPRGGDSELPPGGPDSPGRQMTNLAIANVNARDAGIEGLIARQNQPPRFTPEPPPGIADEAIGADIARQAGPQDAVDLMDRMAGRDLGETIPRVDLEGQQILPGFAHEDLAPRDVAPEGPHPLPEGDMTQGQLPLHGEKWWNRRDQRAAAGQGEVAGLDPEQLADFGPEYTADVLNGVPDGPPGFSKTSEEGVTHLTYRGPDGKAIADATIFEAGALGEGTPATVSSWAADKTKGLLYGRAVAKMKEEFIAMGATRPTGEYSADTRNFVERAQANAQARGADIADEALAKEPELDLEGQGILPGIERGEIPPRDVAPTEPNIEIPNGDKPPLQLKLKLRPESFWQRRRIKVSKEFKAAWKKAVDSLDPEKLRDSIDWVYAKMTLDDVPPGKPGMEVKGDHGPGSVVEIIYRGENGRPVSYMKIFTEMPDDPTGSPTRVVDFASDPTKGTQGKAVFETLKEMVRLNANLPYDLYSKYSKEFLTRALEFMDDDSGTLNLSALGESLDKFRERAGDVVKRAAKSETVQTVMNKAKRLWNEERGSTHRTPEEKKRVVDLYRKGLDDAPTYNSTHFVLPDGTRKTFNKVSDYHEGASQAVGTSLHDGLRSGVMRFFQHKWGIVGEVAGPISSQQARHLVNARVQSGLPSFDLDVNLPNGEIKARHFDDRATPDTVANWVNSFYPNEFARSGDQLVLPEVNPRDIPPPDRVPGAVTEQFVNTKQRNLPFRGKPLGNERGSIPLGSPSQMWNKYKDWSGVGQGPQAKPVKGQPTKEFSILKEILQIPRNINTTLDLSAPGRQGLGLINTPEFWKALGPMLRGGMSKKAFDAIDSELRRLPTFQRKLNARTGKMMPSIAEEAGIKLYEPAGTATPGTRAESAASRWLETGEFGNKNIPGITAFWKNVPGRPIRASNRAYITFLNHLRANRFEFLMNQTRHMSDVGIKTGKTRMPGMMGGVDLPEWMGGGNIGFKQAVTRTEAAQLNGFQNKLLAKEIADFVNTATGAGPLRTHILPHKNWEKSAEKASEILAHTLFSPGLLASRVRMMNPNTYIMASPFVRRQYAKSMMGTLGAWWGMLQLIKMAGGEDEVEVSMDPTNSDFGKARIGDTRLDPGGGFGQWSVLFGRSILYGGWTSSSNPEEGMHRFGQGFNPETHTSNLMRFASNKLDPVAKFAYDVWDASENKPVHMKDRVAQMFIPLFIQDLISLYKEDPQLVPFAIPAFFGIGSQTYGKYNDPDAPQGKIIDAENDWIYSGGGNLQAILPWNQQEEYEDMTWTPR